MSIQIISFHMLNSLKKNRDFFMAIKCTLILGIES